MGVPVAVWDYYLHGLCVLRVVICVVCIVRFAYRDFLEFGFGVGFTDVWVLVLT